MSQEDDPRISQEPLEEDLFESLALERDSNDAISNKQIDPDPGISLRPEFEDDLSRANVHYGSRNEGDHLVSRVTGGTSAGALGGTSQDLGPLNGRMAAGEVFLEGDRTSYEVSESVHGNFTIRDIESGDEINVTNVEFVHFGDLTMHRDFLMRSNPTIEPVTKALDGEYPAASSSLVPGVEEAANTSPIVTDQAFATDEDRAITITEAQLLTGASDLDNDSLWVTAVAGSPNGEVVNNGDGTWTFTPDDNFNGQVDFTFTVSDGQGGETTATATIDVTPVNDGPVVTDQSFTTDEDTAITITEAELLAGASDLDGDALSVTAVTGSDSGTVVDNGDGTWTFTPDDEFSGQVDITFTVSDGQGGDTTATAGTAATRGLLGARGNDLAALVDLLALPLQQSPLLTIHRLRHGCLQQRLGLR